MKVLLITLTLFFTHMMVKAQNGDNFISDYSVKWENAMAYTMEFAELMPADAYDFKPTEEQRSFAEQLTHICGNILWLSTDYLGGKDITGGEFDKNPTEKAEVITLLEKSFQHAAETISNFDPDHLDDEVQFFAGPMSKRRIMFLMTDHVTHHRGQLVVYLRLKGLEPPAYRGW